MATPPTPPTTQPSTTPPVTLDPGLAQAFGNAVGNPSLAPAWYTTLSPAQQQAVQAKFKQTYNRSFDAKDPILQTADVRDLLLGSVPFQPGLTQTGQSLGIPAGPMTQYPTAPGVQSSSTVAQVQAAIMANPRSAPYMERLISVADAHGVPWQVLWSLVQGESKFDETATGDQGQSHGLVQIFGPSNPGITPDMANDPSYALEYGANRLQQAYSKYHDWSLAVLSHNSPVAADALFNSGQHAPGRDLIDTQYLKRTLGSLPAGTGFDPSVDTKMAAIPGLSGSGSSGGSALTLPDPTLMRQQAQTYLKGLFFRDPTDQELDGMVNAMTGAIASSAQQKTGPNPFAPETGVTMVNPVPGARETGTYGEDRGGHIHQGVDLAVPVGSPVLAPVGGYVTWDTTSDPSGYGNQMILKGDDGRTYLFGHLSEAVAKSGTRVDAGTQIAKSGGAAGAAGSGDSSGPHVHFEIRQDGGPGPQGQINPEPSLSGATQLATEGEVQSGQLATQTDVDWKARMLETLRQSKEYQDLYGAKPAGQSEQDYANQFTRVGQSMLGVAPPDEAVRLGLQTNSPSTTAGFVAGSAGSDQNPTFRQLLFQKAALISQMA